MGGGLVRQPSLGVLLSFLLCCCVQKKVSSSTNIIYPTQSLTGNQTIISSVGTFELGYFTLGSPARYYVGIWFKNIPVDNVVWVANRNRPLQDNTGEFKISKNGNLVLQTQSGSSVIWSTNLNPSPSSNSMIAVLLDTGNLVLRDRISSGKIFWDSFSYPTNTWLPGQIFGLNKATKQRQCLTSWKNLQDPSPGPFSDEIDPNGTAQFFFLWNKTQKYWSTGIWDGHIFSDVPEMRGQPLRFNYVANDTVSYFSYSFLNSTIVSKFVLDYTGQIKLFIWDKGSSQWVMFWVRPTEYQTCEVYGLCGAFGACNNQVGLKPCQCINGFKPASTKNWELNDWSDGCVRKNKLQCAGDQFSLLPMMRAPAKSDASTALQNAEDCKSICLKDCSCTAYSYKGSNCSIWRGDLFNLRQLYEGTGDGVYIRLAGLQAPTNDTTKKQPAPVLTESSSGGDRHRKAKRALIFLAIPLVATVCIALGAYLFWRYNTKKRDGPNEARLAAAIGIGEEGGAKRGPDLPLYDLRVIVVATNDFSESNKLGEGGFGVVYKGELSGQQVAVKRLSKESKQGVEELINEVNLIAKLQHRNLVQLLGFCVEGEEKILVYEYMPNKSLDTFIFGDGSLRRQVGWEKRLEIMMGIARGLHYLHIESRLRVIHRDLKGSNILLDGEMNPRISDFGLARIFDGDQSDQVNTHRVMGTYGYMAPEYALEGRYSIKSDVFSFGVIVLEIVSGLRMTRFQDMEHSLNLLGHAWKLWSEDKAADLLDPLLGTPSELDQVMRWINVGLLCVQEDVADRPTMASICLMLGGNPAVLPAPKHPAYSHKGKRLDESSPHVGSEPTTTPISVVEAR